MTSLVCNCFLSCSSLRAGKTSRVSLRDRRSQLLRAGDLFSKQMIFWVSCEQNSFCQQTCTDFLHDLNVKDLNVPSVNQGVCASFIINTSINFDLSKCSGWANANANANPKGASQRQKYQQHFFLRSFSCYACSPVNLEGVKGVGGCGNLKELKLQSTQSTEAGCQEGAAYSKSCFSFMIINMMREKLKFT